jgi:copper chaperone CopZ
MSVTRRFDVTGMSCGGCERSLTRAVSQLPGVSAVDASHVDRTATVTYDENAVTPDAIAEAIRDAGYVPADPAASPR